MTEEPGAPLLDIHGAEQFAKDVIEASKKTPIVVDFWASWCAPCRVLGPVLEQAVASYGGKVRLAKLNVEEPENQVLAQEFGIRGIPAVKIFKDGHVAHEFVGAVPAEQVQQVLREVMPSEADERLARAKALAEAGKADDAAAMFRQVLAEDARQPAACVGLGRLLVGRGQFEEAKDLLGRVGPQHADEHAEAEALQARIRFASGCAGGETAASLARKVKEHPDDLGTRMALGNCLAAEGKYREALEEYLFVLSKGRSYGEGAARKAMVEVFAVVGQRSPLAEEYRDRMSKILYS